MNKTRRIAKDLLPVEEKYKSKIEKMGLGITMDFWRILGKNKVAIFLPSQKGKNSRTLTPEFLLFSAYIKKSLSAHIDLAVGCYISSRLSRILNAKINKEK